MNSVNPFAEFRKACEKVLQDALKRGFPEASVSPSLSAPPSSDFGELSSSICFKLAKQLEARPLEIANQIVEIMEVPTSTCIQSTKAAGRGYINFYVKLAEFSKLTIESVRAFKSAYGQVKISRPERIIVEHTSVNPIHPIHIGQARNPMLGDAIARLLTTRGHSIFRHYYVDDVGRQTAVIAYGYEKLGRPKPEGKLDQFIGTIYTITSCIIEVEKLNREIEYARGRAAGEEAAKLERELADWSAIAVELEAKHSKLYTTLRREIQRDPNPESKISSLIQRYEGGEERAKHLIREVSEICLDGFKETLEKAGVYFDSWDWESDFVWNGDVKRVLSKLEATPYVFHVGKVSEFDANKVAVDLDLKKELGLREDYEIPSLTLTRADGTTLYTTRDIPYTLWKFQKADRVINVVGMDQPLPQLQLKLALCALGHIDYARRLTHFAYNLVRLPNFRMSSRRGRYITFDEVLDEAIKRAYQEVSKRSPKASEETKRRISNLVGIGAVKYALVEVDPSKPVVFSWDSVLDFEKNSAPYIQYSFARASSILRRANRQPLNPNFALLTDPFERDLILLQAKFPDVVIDSADNLRPNEIADFANALADKFNSFYNALPVIKTQPPELSDARLALVEATKIVLRNALNLLGIEAPVRM